MPGWSSGCCQSATWATIALGDAIWKRQLATLSLLSGEDVWGRWEGQHETEGGDKLEGGTAGAVARCAGEEACAERELGFTGQALIAPAFPKSRGGE